MLKCELMQEPFFYSLSYHTFFAETRERIFFPKEFIRYKEAFFDEN